MTKLHRNPHHAKPDLAQHVVDFLLGVNRPIAEIEELRANGIEYDSFYQFDADLTMTDDECRRLWQTHGAQLRREAKRRGLNVPAVGG
jgi:hypothetical protein